MWVMGFCLCQLQANLHGNGPGEKQLSSPPKNGQLFQFVNFRERGLIDGQRPQKLNEEARLWLKEL